MKVLLKFYTVNNCENFGCLKFWTLKNFGWFYFRTLFLSKIKIIRNFLQVKINVIQELTVKVKNCEHLKYVWNVYLVNKPLQAAGMLADNVCG